MWCGLQATWRARSHSCDDPHYRNNAARVHVTTDSAKAAAKMGASSSFFAMPMAPSLTPRLLLCLSMADSIALDELEQYTRRCLPRPTVTSMC